MGRPSIDQDFLKTFGERLSMRCVELGVSQADLARLTGFNTSHVNLICTGKTNTSIQVLNILCDALDISADELMGRTPIGDSVQVTSMSSHEPFIHAIPRFARIAELLKETSDYIFDEISGITKFTEMHDGRENTTNIKDMSIDAPETYTKHMLKRNKPPHPYIKKMNRPKSDKVFADAEVLVEKIKNPGEYEYFSNIGNLAKALEWDRNRTRAALQILTGSGRVTYKRKEYFEGEEGKRIFKSRGMYVVMEEPDEKTSSSELQEEV